MRTDLIQKLVFKYLPVAQEIMTHRYPSKETSWRVNLAPNTFLTTLECRCSVVHMLHIFWASIHAWMLQTMSRLNFHNPVPWEKLSEKHMNMEHFIYKLPVHNTNPGINTRNWLWKILPISYSNIGLEFSAYLRMRWNMTVYPQFYSSIQFKISLHLFCILIFIMIMKCRKTLCLCFE